MPKRPPPRDLVLWTAGGVLLLAAAVVTIVAVLDDSTEGTLHDGAYVVASALFPVIAVGVAFSAVDAFREGRGPNPLGAAMVLVAGVVAVGAAGATAALDDDGGGAGDRSRTTAADPSRFGIAERQNACSQVGFGSLPPLPRRYAYVNTPIPAPFREAAKGGSGVVARRITENGKTVASLLSVALGPQTQPNQDFLVQAGTTLKRQGVDVRLLALKPYGALAGDLPKGQGSVVVGHGTCRAYYLVASDPPSSLGMARIVLDADQALKQQVEQRFKRQGGGQRAPTG